ncbi:MAG: LemA family protein, partial [Opitutales bacterium]
MQTYLCSRCHQKVPRAKLIDHRRDCGGDVDEHKGVTGLLGRGVKTIGLIALAVALSALSIVLGISGFHSLAGMRQLERVPATSVRAVLPGEVNLNGEAEMLDRTLKAPDTGTPCVYYRYLVEREERDSDGDTRWVTEKDERKYVPFLLRDDTGAVELIPDAGVDFSVDTSWSDQRGNRRYKEFRIDPGDSLFVFGYALRSNDTFQVVFNQQGHYQPIISEHGETRERIGMAGGSIAKAWFGLVALALALSLLISVFRQHRLLVYFTLLNLAVAVYLVVLGLNMMKLDLRAAADRLETYSETVQTETRRLLRSRNIDWEGDWESLPDFQELDGLPEETGIRLEEIRLTLARSVERVRAQRSAFPERFLAPLWDIPKPAPLPLPDRQQAIVTAEGTGLEKAKIPPGIGLLLSGVSLLVGIITFFFGFRRVKFKRCMENLPTSPTTGAAYGLAEFKGVVDLPEHAELLKGPLSHQPCVQYHYKVQEKRGSGKKSKWVTVVDQHHRIPFLCRDGDGAMVIDPAGAEIHSSHHTTRRRGQRRYTETRLEHGDPLYAIGECRLDPARGDRLYLCKPEGPYPFILGNLSEARMMLRVARKGILLLNLSFAGIVLTALLFFGLSGSFAATDYLAAALSAPLFMTCVTLALHYNDLVFLRERVRRNWSNIDVSLKKRADLVPQLENITRSLMKHEREVQEAVTDMRKMYGAKVERTPEGVQQYMRAEHASLNRLMLTAEAYPDLKSDRQTALLMRTLIVLENEISLMRNGYNDAVETYNTRIQTFPDLFFARLFHFQEKQLLFAETEVTRIPPSIQALWEQDQLPTSSKPEGEDHPPEKTEVADDPDAPADIAALAALTPEATGTGETEDIPSPAIESFLALLRGSPADIKETFDQAEALYPELRKLTPSAYRHFKAEVLRVMEEDNILTVLEYAMQQSIRHHLDPAFGLSPKRPIRHTDFPTMIDSVSDLLSLLAMLEESPENRQSAFDTGVANLNHKPASDFRFRECDPDNLSEFDDVLEDIAHAAPMHRANVAYACEALVKLNHDATPRQILMLYAIADTL